MRVKPSSSTKAILTEFGRFPLKIKQKCQMIKYWKRILDMNGTSLVKKAYNSIHELYDLCQSNWCTFVKEILNEVYIQQAWEDKTFDNKQYAFLKENLHQSIIHETMFR